MLNKGLEISVVETNNHWTKRERVRKGGEELIMIATYNNVKNTLGIHLRYSKTMGDLNMSPYMVENSWAGIIGGVNRRG